VSVDGNEYRRAIMLGEAPARGCRFARGRETFDPRRVSGVPYCSPNPREAGESPLLRRARGPRSGRSLASRPLRTDVRELSS
jgi:hypothetical protein